MGTNRGFISILTITVAVFVAAVVTAGGFYVTQYIQSDQEDATSSVQVNTEADTEGQEKKPLNLEDYRLSEKDTSNTSENQPIIENAKAVPTVDVASAVYIDALTSDISSFKQLSTAVDTNKKLYISYAEDAGIQRADALGDLAQLASDGDLRNLIKESAADFRAHAENASELSEPYELVQKEVDRYLDATIEMKAVLEQGGSDSSVGNLLATNQTQLDRLTDLLGEANAAVQRIERIKANNFSDTIESIDKIITVQNVSASLSTRLADLENDASQSTLPSSAIRCYATTNFEGGIINGTARTFVRCE